MAANPEHLQDFKTIAFSLNGETIKAYEDETILEAARRYTFAKIGVGAIAVRHGGK